MAIVSFEHGFCFVKTHKTAGTSLEVHLARECGPEDVVTPINPPNPAHHPRNFERPDGTRFRNHMPARELRALLGGFWDEAFTFCFERHPIDKSLSHFAMLVNSPAHAADGNPTTWADYLDAGRFPTDDQQYLDDDGRLLVDRVFAYETLDDALSEIHARTGIGAGPLGVREKGGFRTAGVPSYDEVAADPAQRDRILAAFARSLPFTGYR